MLVRGPPAIELLRFQPAGKRKLSLCPGTLLLAIVMMMIMMTMTIKCPCVVAFFMSSSSCHGMSF